MGMLDEMMLRTLLHSNSPDEDHTAESDAPDENYMDETKALRIASIFIILAAGLVGGVPPLFMKTFRSPGHPLPRIMRALSAGIILSLACIHILPEAVLEMDELGSLMGDYPYNPAGACAVFGALLMVFMDSVTHFFIDKRTEAARKADFAVSKEAEPTGAFSEQSLAVSEAIVQHDLHTHTCAGQAHVMLKSLPTPNVRDQVIAFLFELGCIFHSFIIGLTLGVNADNMKQVRALLIALCFHQCLEGIALASFITRANIASMKGMSMVVLYSLTCPIGVAIGVGIADSYDAESTKAIAVQGVFNGVSAGMLLYIALVQLIAEDFTRREVPLVQPPHLAPASKEDCSKEDCEKPVDACSASQQQNLHESGWLLAASHAALFFGAACMALLAIWA